MLLASSVVRGRLRGGAAERGQVEERLLPLRRRLAFALALVLPALLGVGGRAGLELRGDPLRGGVVQLLEAVVVAGVDQELGDLGGFRAGLVAVGLEPVVEVLLL